MNFIADCKRTPARIRSLRRSGIARMIVVAGVGIALFFAAAGFTMGGGGMSGTGYAARLVLAVASLAFVLAHVSAPLSRMMPTAFTRALGRARAALDQAFAAVFAVFLACIVLPYPATGERIPTSTLALAVLSIPILAVMVFSTRSRRALGSSAGRAITGLSKAFFWCLFAASALDHLVGPHQAFYAFLLSLLVFAALIGFADALVRRHKTRMAGAL